MNIDLEILEAIKKIIAAKGDCVVSYSVNSETIRDLPFSKSPVKNITQINIKLEKPT